MRLTSPRISRAQFDILTTAKRVQAPARVKLHAGHGGHADAREERYSSEQSRASRCPSQHGGLSGSAQVNGIDARMESGKEGDAVTKDPPLCLES